jgi:hypothetical protein
VSKTQQDQESISILEGRGGKIALLYSAVFSLVWILIVCRFQTKYFVFIACAPSWLPTLNHAGLTHYTHEYPCLRLPCPDCLYLSVYRNELNHRTCEAAAARYGIHFTSCAHDCFHNSDLLFIMGCERRLFTKEKCGEILYNKMN